MHMASLTAQTYAEEPYHTHCPKGVNSLGWGTHGIPDSPDLCRGATLHLLSKGGESFGGRVHMASLTAQTYAEEPYNTQV